MHYDAGKRTNSHDISIVDNNIVGGYAFRLRQQGKWRTAFSIVFTVSDR